VPAERRGAHRGRLATAAITLPTYLELSHLYRCGRNLISTVKKVIADTSG
jgi:hypothetical protein